MQCLQYTGRPGLASGQQSDHLVMVAAFDGWQQAHSQVKALAKEHTNGKPSIWRSGIWAAQVSFIVSSSMLNKFVWFSALLVIDELSHLASSTAHLLDL